MGPSQPFPQGNPLTCLYLLWLKAMPFPSAQLPFISFEGSPALFNGLINPASVCGDSFGPWENLRHPGHSHNLGCNQKHTHFMTWPPVGALSEPLAHTHFQVLDQSLHPLNVKAHRPHSLVSWKPSSVCLSKEEAPVNPTLGSGWDAGGQGDGQHCLLPRETHTTPFFLCQSLSLSCTFTVGGLVS